MGWSCYLESDRQILEEDIEKIITTIPVEIQRPHIGRVKQNWGWSLACDVMIPRGKNISIGGAYGISGDIKEPFVKHFEDGLKMLGHNVKATWSH